MWISLCHWAPFWVTQKDTFPFEPPEDTQCKDWSTDLWNCVIVKDDDWILNGLFSIFNIDIVKDDDHKFLNYVSHFKYGSWTIKYDCFSYDYLYILFDVFHR
jgi:hypothetical protein